MDPEIVERLVRHAWVGRQCRKSARGAAAVMDGRVIAVAVNGPPGGRCCTNACQESRRCREYAAHAEARVVGMVGRAYSYSPGRYDVVHVKVVDGSLVASGPPSCLPCASAMLDCGDVQGVWLHHECGWRRYGVEAFYDLTLAHHGLSGIGV